MPKPLGIQSMFDDLDAVVFKPKDGKDRPGLYLEECSYQAAKYAVEHWHYSGNMVHSSIASFGVWESGRFIGTIVYGVSANQHLFKKFAIEDLDGCELMRVAFQSHALPVSQSIAVSLKLLKRMHPRLRLVGSFADTARSHLGGIYKAGNWFYLGTTSPSDEYVVGGRQYHGKGLRAVRKTSAISSDGFKNVMEWAAFAFQTEVKVIAGSVKHRYFYPLDPAMRAQISPLRKPYPTSVGSAVGGTVSVQETGDGSIPIPTPPGLVASS